MTKPEAEGSVAPPAARCPTTTTPTRSTFGTSLASEDDEWAERPRMSSPEMAKARRSPGVLEVISRERLRLGFACAGPAGAWRARRRRRPARPRVRASAERGARRAAHRGARRGSEKEQFRLFWAEIKRAEAESAAGAPRSPLRRPPMRRRLASTALGVSRPTASWPRVDDAGLRDTALPRHVVPEPRACARRAACRRGGAGCALRAVIGAVPRSAHADGRARPHARRRARDARRDRRRLARATGYADARAARAPSALARSASRSSTRARARTGRATRRHAPTSTRARSSPHAARAPARTSLRPDHPRLPWSPASEWTRTHWSRALFEETLPAPCARAAHAARQATTTSRPSCGGRRQGRERARGRARRRGGAARPAGRRLLPVAPAHRRAAHRVPRHAQRVLPPARVPQHRPPGAARDWRRRDRRGRGRGRRRRGRRRRRGCRRRERAAAGDGCGDREAATAAAAAVAAAADDAANDAADDDDTHALLVGTRCQPALRRAPPTTRATAPPRWRAGAAADATGAAPTCGGTAPPPSRLSGAHRDATRRCGEILGKPRDQLETYSTCKQQVLCAAAASGDGAARDGRPRSCAASPRRLAAHPHGAAARARQRRRRPRGRAPPAKARGKRARGGGGSRGATPPPPGSRGAARRRLAARADADERRRAARRRDRRRERRGPRGRTQGRAGRRGAPSAASSSRSGGALVARHRPAGGPFHRSTSAPAGAPCARALRPRPTGIKAQAPG